MRALPWLSDTFRHLKPRERRVVLGGAVVSATALVVVLLVLPFGQRWTEREAAYAARREHGPPAARTRRAAGGLRRRPGPPRERRDARALGIYAAGTAATVRRRERGAARSCGRRGRAAPRQAGTARDPRAAPGPRR